MVLDVATGLVLAGSVAVTPADAVDDACRMALHQPMVPAGAPVARRPETVHCDGPLEPAVAKAFKAAGQVAVAEGPVYPEAEDVFDSLVGFLAGRAQPNEMPSPADWAALYAAAHDFYTAAPWSRWADTARLKAELDIAGSEETCTVIVLGNEEVQHGLAVVPVGPEESREVAWEDGGVPGTALLLFDPPSEVPAELSMKAARYGWPQDAHLVPVTMVLDDGSGHEPSSSEVRRLTVAAMATTDHTSRSLSVVGHEPATTTGVIKFADGPEASYAVTTAP